MLCAICQGGSGAGNIGTTRQCRCSGRNRKTAATTRQGSIDFQNIDGTARNNLDRNGKSNSPNLISYIYLFWGGWEISHGKSNAFTVNHLDLFHTCGFNLSSIQERSITRTKQVGC